MSDPESPLGKLEELALYLAARSETDPHFGATKLNKLLYAIDFEAYRTLGRPVTGQRYQKLEYGPAPRGMVPALEELERSGAAIVSQRLHYGRAQKKLIALRDPSLSAFSADEVALADALLSKCWGRTATELSEETHEHLGWRLASHGEDIPYETAFLGESLPLTDDDEAWAGEAVLELSEA